MNKQVTGKLTLLFFAISFHSCIKDSAKLPAPPTACDTISYAKHIAPIVAQKCTKSCHNAGNPSGNVIFGTYEVFKAKAVEGKIEDRVIKATPSIMPPSDPDTAVSGPLPKAQLDRISCWLKNGYKP